MRGKCEWCEEEKEWIFPFHIPPDKFVGFCSYECVSAAASEEEVTPVEVEEVMDEDDFIHAGIAAREKRKKTAMESAQEWIDNNPGWVDSFSDFVASKSGQVTEE